MPPALGITHERFAHRYLEWAVSEVRREIAEDFPRLRRVHSLSTVAFLDEIQRWSRDDVHAYMTGSLRARVTGEPSPEVLPLLARFQAALASSAIRLLLFQRGFASEKAAPFDRRAFRSMAERALRRDLGPHKRDGSVSRFRSLIANCTVCTDVDFGGKGRQVGYRQIIYAGRHEDYWPLDAHSSRLSRFDISLVEWLGLGKTSWEFLTNENSQDIVELVRKWSTYFLSEADRLLADEQTTDAGAPVARETSYESAESPHGSKGVPDIAESVTSCIGSVRENLLDSFATYAPQAKSTIHRPLEQLRDLLLGLEERFRTSPHHLQQMQVMAVSYRIMAKEVAKRKPRRLSLELAGAGLVDAGKLCENTATAVKAIVNALVESAPPISGPLGEELARRRR